MDDFIHDYKRYLSTLNKIVLDGEAKDRLDAADYFDTNRMDYLLAHLLESGNCHIKDKMTNSTIADVVMEKYSYDCGPLCESGGRRFYIKENLFLETEDWIS